MDTLVALGSGSAFLWSTWQLRQGGEVWFDSAAMLVTFLLVGRTLEARARGRASEAIRGLLDLRVPMASVLRGDGVEVELRVEQLEPGDRVVQGPGARGPGDGGVEAGRS